MGNITAKTATDRAFEGVVESQKEKLLKMYAKKLTLPPKLISEAERIMSSVLENNTASGAINSIRSTGMLPTPPSISNK